jgi:hypothetical protein
VKLIVKQLFEQGGSEPVVSFRPVFFSSRTTGVVQFPLYRTDVVYSFGANRSGQNQSLRDQIFVDDVGRYYKAEPHKNAFEIWEATNKLPSGVVVSPSKGRISRDKTGALGLEVGDTPEKGRGGEKAVTAAMMVGGIFAGGLTLVGAGGGIVSWIGVTSSLHGAGTAWAELDDRRTHGQSNAWSDPEGRALKLNLAASMAGLGMFASGPVLKNTVYYGRLTHEAAVAHSLVNAIGAGTDAAAFANGVVHLTKHYKEMSPDDIGLALLQLCWQGLMSGVGIRQAGGLGATFNPMVGARMLIAQHLPPPRIHYGSNEVAGNAVEIRLVNGHRYEIFAGPQADQARIQHHVDVVRQIEGDIRFTEMLARWLGARSDTEGRSIAADIRKLNSWIAQQTLKLESSVLDPGERTATLNDIAVCKRRRDELIGRWQELRNNPGVDRGGQPILLPNSTGPGSAQAASTSGQFMNWLGNKHPGLLRDARTALRQQGFDVDQVAHSGAALYRDQPTNPAGYNTAYAVDNIVAWIVQSQKGWGKGKYREIYEKYLDLIDARKKELNRLKSLPTDHWGEGRTFGAIPSASNVESPTMVGTRSPEHDFGDWLNARYPAICKEAAKAADYDVDKMVKWLVQSKYQLGVNPKYNEIFWKYIELNNKRLNEMRDLASAPAPSPTGPVRWVIDPVTRTPVPFEPGAWAPPAVAPIPHEPRAPAPGNTTAHDEPQTLHGGPQTLRDDPTIIQDARGHVLVFVKKDRTDDFVGRLFASIGDRNSPQARDFIHTLRTRIESIGNQSLTVGDFLELVRYYARGAFDRTTADGIANKMAELSTNDPHVVSSERLRDDYRLNTADLLAALK